MDKKITTTLNEIPNLAKEVAKEIRGGEILALIGPLGAGKTTFTQALAKELAIKQSVTSPTFVIMNRYAAKTKFKAGIYFYHLDLYRTENFKEVQALGITEIWGKPDTVTIIEWADKINNYLPKTTTIINFMAP